MIELKIIISALTILLMIYIVFKSKSYALIPLFVAHIAVKIDSFLRHSDLVTFESIRWSVWAFALYFCIAIAEKNDAKLRVTGAYVFTLTPLFLLFFPALQSTVKYIILNWAGGCAMLISAYVFFKSVLMLSSSSYAPSSAIISLIYFFSELSFKLKNDISMIFTDSVIDLSIFYGWYAIESILLIIMLRVTKENASNYNSHI